MGYGSGYAYESEYQRRKRVKEEKVEKDKYYREHIDEALEYVYIHFRASIAFLEELLDERQLEIPDKEQKRLDKAVTLIKVGGKIIKKSKNRQIAKIGIESILLESLTTRGN